MCASREWRGGVCEGKGRFMSNQQNNLPREIVVDLDGTLVHSDMLVENIFAFIRIYPLRLLQLFQWLLRGKAYLKSQLAAAVIPDTRHLPYNQDLVAWLRLQKKNGARLTLATASNTQIAHQIAEQAGLFDEVMASAQTNLSSVNKRDALDQRYGKFTYEYVGNSHDDIAVWEHAAVCHVASPDRGVLDQVRKIGRLGQIFYQPVSYGRSLVKAMRIHQWAKNLLVLVPLFASHRMTETALILSGVLAFFAFGACASSVYLLNDLFDLPDDRQHPTKSNRPLAAGTFPITHAVAWMGVLFLSAFVSAAVLLPTAFVLILMGYYALTLAYSLWLKRVVMLDVVALAMLYTVRVIAGAAAMGLVVTFWILAFCIFIFLSLAFVKRYTELCDARAKGKTTQTSGRGYMPDDFELLASLGGSSGYISALVLALYINDPATLSLYASPQWMWAACPLLLFWLSRVWLLAHRGQMHDDPIVFALRDGVSRWVGVGFVAVFVLASRT